MQNEILYRPSYSLLRLLMEPGEQLLAEAGAMVSMTPNIQMETAARGGILGGLKRAVLGGESFFINTFTCANGQGEITLAPSLPGDMMHIPMAGGTMMVQSGSFICSTTGVSTDTSWGGAKTFFGGEGLFLLKCEGQGDLFVSSYGAIHAVELQPGQAYVVDTGHVVAFEATMTFNVRGAGGLKQTLFSGEGLVCEFVGPGRLYLQSRSFQALIRSIIPHLPKSSN
ncbi:MAG: TIGR00266 family protein [Armatimonadetes bacterium]|nr:TIGR00266 family protein [Armatimonadota bacterium]